MAEPVTGDRENLRTQTLLPWFNCGARRTLPHLWRTTMENMIAKLLDDFDHGRMTRRQLIKSLALVGAAATGVAPATGENSKRFRPVAVNHISYQVSDYAKTR